MHLVLASLLLAAALEESGAPSTEERLQQLRERRATLEADLKNLRSQERTLLGEVEQLELEVRLRTEELHEAQIVLEETQWQLDQTLQRERTLQRSVDEARPILRARARSLYKLGPLSYLRLLLSVDRPADLMRGYRFTAALARRDRERMATFKNNLRELAETRTQLEQRRREALRLRSTLDRVRRQRDADRQRKTARLMEIVSHKEVHAAYVQELEAAELRLGEMISGLGTGMVTVPLSALRGALAWPIDGRVRRDFGRQRHPRFETYTVSNGIDLEAPEGTPVRAVHDGTVVFMDRFRGYGLMVVLDHGGRYHTLYAHLKEHVVSPGMHVSAGQILGSVGSSGLEGAGLYFEVRVDGRPQDPLQWLKAR